MVYKNFKPEGEFGGRFLNNDQPQFKKHTNSISTEDEHKMFWSEGSKTIKATHNTLPAVVDT